MFDFLARRKRGECAVSEVDSDGSVSGQRYRVGFRLDKEAEIPAGGSFEKSGSFYRAFRDVLFVESQSSEERKCEATISDEAKVWGVARNAVQAVSLAFEFGAL